MRTFNSKLLSSVIGGFFGKNKTSELGTTSEKRLVRASMPNHFGFRKKPCIAETKYGERKLMTFKTADKKGLKIVDTLGALKRTN